VPDHDDLERELVALGRSLVVDPPRPDLAESVLARIASPEPARRPFGAPSTRRPRRRRLGWAIATGIVLVIALIPPVRAAVVELLRIGGVVVREEPRPSLPPTTAPTTAPPTRGAGATGSATGTAMSLERARQILGVDVAVPASLGPPSSVVVAHDGTVVELTWDRHSGPARLDAFVGSLSWGYVKTVWDAITPTQVAGQEAVWFGSPHLIEWVDRRGTSHSEPPRLAGPTLVWVVPTARGEVTYRLEGLATLPEALKVAESAH
jgi:hypothetical protein